MEEVVMEEEDMEDIEQGELIDLPHLQYLLKQTKN